MGSVSETDVLEAKQGKHNTRQISCGKGIHPDLLCDTPTNTVNIRGLNSLGLRVGADDVLYSGLFGVASRDQARDRSFGVSRFKKAQAIVLIMTATKTRVEQIRSQSEHSAGFGGRNILAQIKFLQKACIWVLRSFPRCLLGICSQCVMCVCACIVVGP